MSKQESSTEFTLARSVTHLLHRAQQAAVNESANGLADKGLTIRQFAVLAALNDEDGQSQSSLVDVTGIDRSTLADMVSRMEKTGLVKRVKSVEDARAKAVSLTKAGQEAFEGAAPEVMRADEILTEEGFDNTGLTREEITLFQPVGCDSCNKGYKGRVGVYEVVRITDSISRIIMEGGNSIQIADQARKEGFNNLRISALRKAAMGVTSLEEANRVTKD
jgi:DNA-binding MarR family transcriptional regulator